MEVKKETNYQLILNSHTAGHEQLSLNAYSGFYDNYDRLDFKAGYTLNSGKKKISHIFSFDLQNVTNHNNVFSLNYDDRSQSIRTNINLDSSRRWFINCNFRKRKEVIKYFV